MGVGKVVVWDERQAGTPVALTDLDFESIYNGLVAVEEEWEGEVFYGTQYCLAGVSAAGVVTLYEVHTDAVLPLETYAPNWVGQEIVQVAGGLALLADGTLLYAGDPNYTPFDPIPVGITATKIAYAGSGIYVVRKTDGTLSAWKDGRCSSTYLLDTLPTDPVADMAVGNFVGVAIRAADGVVIAWGAGRDDRVRYLPVGLVATEVAVGIDVAMALGTDGVVHVWGEVKCGEDLVPPDLVANHVFAARSGVGRCWATRADGTFVGWGGIASVGRPPA